MPKRISYHHAMENLRCDCSWVRLPWPKANDSGCTIGRNVHSLPSTFLLAMSNQRRIIEIEVVAGMC